MHKMITKHHNLEYRLIGNTESKSAIIALPSFGCHADYCFEEIILELSKENSLYLFNHPAHGFSKGSLKIPEMQESMYEIAQSLKGKHDNLGGLGHSFGSYILATSLDKSLVKALVLIGLPENLKDTKVVNDLGLLEKLPYSVSKEIFNLYDKIRLKIHERYRVSNLPYRSKGDTYFGAIKMTENIFEDIKKLCKEDKSVSYYKTKNDLPRTLLVYGKNENRLGYSPIEMSNISYLLNTDLIRIPSADHNLNITRKSGKIGFKENQNTLQKIVTFFKKHLNFIAK